MIPAVQESVLRANDENVANRHCRIGIIRRKDQPSIVWRIY